MSRRMELTSAILTGRNNAPKNADSSRAAMAGQLFSKRFARCRECTVSSASWRSQWTPRSL